jgi:hypothetical protein
MHTYVININCQHSKLCAEIIRFMELWELNPRIIITCLFYEHKDIAEASR